jgi:type IV pilus assembly protein PilM
VVGIELEAGSVAAAELRMNGSAQLVSAAVEPLPPGVFHEGEVADADGIVQALKELFSVHGLSKQVRLGVGNQRVVVRTVRLPAIEDPKEMEAAVRFQAQEQIPMPLDQAVLEYQVVGGVPAEEGAAPQVDVIVVAARRDMIAALVEPVRRAGLEPVGVDLSAFGMIRALAGEGDQPVADGDPAGPASAILFCNVGDVMNLAVARRRACLFTRVSTVGVEDIVRRVVSECSLSPEHAAQWLSHVGLSASLEEIEGDPETIADVRRILEEGVGALVDELRLSLDYYAAQESAIPVSGVTLCGPGSAIEGIADRMEGGGLDMPISIVRPEALEGYDDATAARLTLPYGIALEA